jgi:hypothetical protein
LYFSKRCIIIANMDSHAQWFRAAVVASSFALFALSACGGSSLTNGSMVPGGTLPPTSTPPAPETAPGAEQAWNDLLSWRDQEAVTCNLTIDAWPAYSCVQQIYDPRRIADFAACMKAMGCGAVQSDDPCLFNPPTPSQDWAPSGDARAWMDTCLAHHTECGFSDDVCYGVLEAMLRPEFRAALRVCAEKPCADVPSCITAAQATSSDCWQ